MTPIPAVQVCIPVGMLASSSMLGHPRQHRHPNNILQVPLSTFVPYRNRSHPPPPPNHVFSNPNTHFPPSHVYLSVIARLPPPPPCLSERNHSSPASTVSIRARTLTPCLHHVHSSTITCLLLQTCHFEPERLSSTSTMSIQV